MAETIGKIVLCYDVSDKHTKVKDALKELGYLENWQQLSTNTIYEMPDTTVWHKNKQVSQALRDITTVCNGLNVKLKKSFSVLIGNEATGYNE